MYQIWGWHELVVFIVFWAKPNEVHNKKLTSWDGIKILGFLGCFALIWLTCSYLFYTPVTNRHGKLTISLANAKKMVDFSMDMLVYWMDGDRLQVVNMKF